VGYPGIGLVSGFFSALFGSGSGSIVVPLLVVRARLTTRAAAGTSLAAMVPTAAFGVAAFAVVGAVEWRYALFLGVPAAGGALVGVWLQGQVSERVARLGFAVLLLALAGRLVAG
jgi:uncharacterized membrane protein YfcA